MTPREIMKTLMMDKQCPERMGLYEHYWDDTLGAWEEQGYPAGADPVDFFHYDLRQIGGWFDTGAIAGQNLMVKETDETIDTINGWGATQRNWKQKSGTPEHLAFDLTDEAKWKAKYREPLLALDTKRFGDLAALKENYTRHMAGDKFCCYTNWTIFEIMRTSMGDVTLLESMYLNPEWITDFCTVVTNHLIMHFEYLFREVGVPDGVWIYEDMGYTNAPFISPELQRELIMPHHKKLGDFIHSYGIPFIMHSCGRIKSFLPAIVEAGVDCLQVLEAKADQHVVEMSKSVDNKIAFMGNLNIKAFETNDPAQLEAEIVPKMKAIRKERIPFVFHSDHSIPRTVTLKTYQTALELYHQQCRY